MRSQGMVAGAAVSLDGTQQDVHSVFDLNSQRLSGKNTFTTASYVFKGRRSAVGS